MRIVQLAAIDGGAKTVLWRALLAGFVTVDLIQWSGLRKPDGFGFKSRLAVHAIDLSIGACSCGTVLERRLAGPEGGRRRAHARRHPVDLRPPVRLLARRLPPAQLRLALEGIDRGGASHRALRWFADLAPGAGDEGSGPGLGVPEHYLRVAVGIQRRRAHERALGPGPARAPPRSTWVPQLSPYVGRTDTRTRTGSAGRPG